uniref:(California timema) hypothetical protein n=1 Tax=Timema californicum TaxID=61474 RepID=A0A7R9P4J4_TIMCA|nr:unnamed protein product [Timema californicum]
MWVCLGQQLRSRECLHGLFLVVTRLFQMVFFELRLPAKNSLFGSVFSSKSCGSIVLVGALKPTVDCSFITEFEDHIFVTVDAEAFFFLHDLITSYVKEKERVQHSHIYMVQFYTNGIVTRNTCSLPSELCLASPTQSLSHRQIVHPWA